MNKTFFIVACALVVSVYFFAQDLQKNTLPPPMDTNTPEDIGPLFPEQKPESMIQFDQQNVDVSNVDQGTLLIQLNIPKEQIPDQEIDSVVIFTSQYIDRLFISYSIEDKTLHGGVPALAARDINLFDGNLHQLVYTYHREKGQSFYLDGKLIATGAYQGRKHEKSLMTGFITKESLPLIDANMHIASYDFVLT